MASKKTVTAKTKKTVPTTPKIGRPRKTEDGMKASLFMRIDQKTATGLDALAEQMQRRTGLSVTRTDIARKILNEAVADVSLPK